MRIAAVNWEIWPDCDQMDRFEEHASILFDRAAQGGAELVVLPENNTYEWLAFLPETDARDVPRLLAEHADRYGAFLQSEAQWRGMTIVGGSCFAQRGERLLNVCPVAFPGGQPIQWVPKVKLTQFEIEPQRLDPGAGLRRLSDPQLGVLVCYDSEFPEAGRVLAESGVRVLCVPAYTETVYGFQRVRWSCLARAIENQIVVVHSSLVGSLGKEPVPETWGSSAIIQPSLAELADAEGRVVHETATNVEEVLVIDVHLASVEAARSKGDVRNWADRDPGVWQFSPEP